MAASGNETRNPGKSIISASQALTWTALGSLSFTAQANEILRDLGALRSLSGTIESKPSGAQWRHGKTGSAFGLKSEGGRHFEIFFIEREKIPVIVRVRTDGLTDFGRTVLPKGVRTDVMRAHQAEGIRPWKPWKWATVPPAHHLFPPPHPVYVVRPASFASWQTVLDHLRVPNDISDLCRFIFVLFLLLFERINCSLCGWSRSVHIDGNTLTKSAKNINEHCSSSPGSVRTHLGICLCK